MLKNLKLSFVSFVFALLSVVSLGQAAPAKGVTFSGENAIGILHYLGTKGVANELAAGNISIKDSKNLDKLKVLFDPKQCESKDWNAGFFRVQSGLIRCAYNKKSPMGTNCTLQDRGTTVKNVTVTGLDADHILKILQTSGVKSVPNSFTKVGEIYEVKSFDCQVEMFRFCDGSLSCQIK